MFMVFLRQRRGSSLEEGVVFSSMNNSCNTSRSSFYHWHHWPTEIIAGALGMTALPEYIKCWIILSTHWIWWVEILPCQTVKFLYIVSLVLDRPPPDTHEHTFSHAQACKHTRNSAGKVNISLGHQHGERDLYPSWRGRWSGLTRTHMHAHVHTYKHIPFLYSSLGGLSCRLVELTVSSSPCLPSPSCPLPSYLLFPVYMSLLSFPLLPPVSWWSPMLLCSKTPTHSHIWSIFDIIGRISHWCCCEL